MADVKQRAAALAAQLEALSGGVERAHRALDEKTAALSSMAASEASRAADLEKERGLLQDQLEAAARSRAELEKQLAEGGTASSAAASSANAAYDSLAASTTPTPGSPDTGVAMESRASVTGAEVRQRGAGEQFESVALDIEAGEGTSLLLNPERAPVDNDDDDGSPQHRGFQPIAAIGLMRRAHPRVATAARALDHATVSAGRLLTGQPVLRLGAFGYLVLIHMLLLLSQAACRRTLL